MEAGIEFHVAGGL